MLSTALILAIGIAGILLLTPKVKATVTMEAGTKMVDVEDFLLKKSSSGSYITDISTLDLNAPGIYKVKIKVGYLVYKSLLQIVDTVAPTATIENQMISLGDEIEAEAFAADVIDATSVKFSYKELPDFEQSGEQEVILILEDTSKNRTELTAMLTILNMKKTVRVEAGSTTVNIEDFIESDGNVVAFETDVSKLDFSKPMIYEIQIRVDDIIYMSQLEVVDTIAPTASILNQKAWMQEAIEPDTFVTGITDATQVKVSYKVAPDFTTLGDQEICIVLEDTSSNKTELNAILTVAEDTEAPQIIGVKNQTVFIGEKVSYKKNISVQDNKDTELELTVDSSTVNLKKQGSYQVTYSATDLSGNKTTITATFTVSSIDQATLDAVVDEVLDKIIDDSMTSREKAYEIYLWTKGHVAYTGHADKDDWIKGAYYGIKKGVGDCNTYYAVSQALLTRAGIDNMLVTRVGGKTLHFWNLVNCGDGWYHFDSCPNKDHMDTFMLTDEEVAAYTEERGNNYYNFDKSLYPATPED